MEREDGKNPAEEGKEGLCVCDICLGIGQIDNSVGEQITCWKCHGQGRMVVIFQGTGKVPVEGVGKMNNGIITGIYYGWGDGQSGYTVGNQGVTRIVENEKNGEMSKIKYYDIWKGDKLYAEMHDYSEIIYGEKKES
jgi:hypothetical protein